MLTYRQAATYLILNLCIVYATHWINLAFFSGRLSSIWLGALTSLLAVSAYPVLAWRRNSSWVRIRSFGAWLLIALALGVFTSAVYAGAGIVVRHYSSS